MSESDVSQIPNVVCESHVFCFYGSWTVCKMLLSACR